MALAVFPVSVKISFEYQMLLGFSRALLRKNRYSRLLTKNMILAQCPLSFPLQLSHHKIG